MIRPRPRLRDVFRNLIFRDISSERRVRSARIQMHEPRSVPAAQRAPSPNSDKSGREGGHRCTRSRLLAADFIPRPSLRVLVFLFAEVRSNLQPAGRNARRGKLRVSAETLLSDTDLAARHPASELGFARNDPVVYRINSRCLAPRRRASRAANRCRRRQRSLVRARACARINPLTSRKLPSSSALLFQDNEHRSPHRMARHTRKYAIRTFLGRAP